ncbi:RND transporter [Skermanella stibiiresistens SB22]|uniref:RND transporter n=1 Tax=Skermanella stibiiresistens SB22 TaxID=1385369 RepID=W9H8Q6_9PROT|nr:RND transporter [Skermanella stibiiresistens SB22]
MHRIRRGFIISTILLVCAILAFGLFQRFYGTPAVAVGTVTRGPAVEAVYASGTVEPVSWAKVQPLTTGRIASLDAFEGDEVKAGQVLMRLDDRELRAAVAQLEAESRFLKSELDRVSELARRGVTTSQVEERARSQLDQALASINAARQRVEDHVLRAPMDGTVLRRDGELGEIARPDDILFWIGRQSPLRIEAEVDEEDIPLVAPGQTALIKADAFAGRVLEGAVADITPKGDPVNKSYRVRIGLPPDTPLMIGMTVESNIVVRREPSALLVPQAALTAGHVFVVKDGSVERRPVVVGVVGQGVVEIKEGLSDGETVVLDPPPTLADGSAIRLKR